MSAPCSPTGETQPRMTSSTREVSRSGLRLRNSSSKPTTRDTGLVPCSDPVFLPRPLAVRMASYTNASVMEIPVGRRGAWRWNRYCQYHCHSCQAPVALSCSRLGGMTAAPARSGDEFTIDELAARTGMTVRTVRFYATEGLLPAPERRGRVAYYGAPHRMRLELIRTLQEH